jgi:hypothetical protein
MIKKEGYIVLVLQFGSGVFPNSFCVKGIFVSPACGAIGRWWNL